MALYSYQIEPIRADFLATITAEERGIMGQHFQYLMSNKAMTRFVGRALNGDFGIVVFEAADMAEAQAVANADPAVALGLTRVRVNEFAVVDL
jgi:uncharacterized protein YciI